MVSSSVSASSSSAVTSSTIVRPCRITSYCCFTFLRNSLPASSFSAEVTLPFSSSCTVLSGVGAAAGAGARAGTAPGTVKPLALAVSNSFLSRSFLAASSPMYRVSCLFPPVNSALASASSSAISSGVNPSSSANKASSFKFSGSIAVDVAPSPVPVGVTDSSTPATPVASGVSTPVVSGAPVACSPLSTPTPVSVGPPLTPLFAFLAFSKSAKNSSSLVDPASVNKLAVCAPLISLLRTASPNIFCLSKVGWFSISSKVTSVFTGALGFLLLYSSTAVFVFSSAL